MSERLSGTVTFLFTDIEGSTSLLKRLGGPAYGELLARQQELVREAFAAHGGEEVDTQGDSFFAAFRSASDAVAAAVGIQRSLAEQEWPEGVEVRVRVGIHSGEAAAAGKRYVGFSVHRAARIGNVANGGQVLLSSSTRELVEDDLPPGVSLRDLGLFRLKDVDRPERISQVCAEGLGSAFPPLRGVEQVKTPVLRRKSALAAALAGVVAAAIAIPVFALSSSGSGGHRSLASVGANAVGAVDAAGRIFASVAVNGSPGAIAYGEGSIWVVNGDHNSVTRIDPTTNTPQQTITVGKGPAGIAVGGGFVWVANSLDDTVSQIDPHANGGQVVRTIKRVGNGPAGVAYGLGALWVADSIDSTVVRIDPKTSEPGRPIAVNDGADAIAVGNGTVWVTSESAGVLSQIDPSAGVVTNTINVGNGPAAVAAGPGAVWVANSHDATVSEIDPATGSVKAVTPVGGGPSGLGVTPVDGSVWVSNALAGTLSRIDPTTASVDKTITVGDQPEAVAVSGETAYVAVKGTGATHVGGTLKVAVANPAGTYTIALPKSLDPAYGYTAWDLLTMTNDGLLGYARSGGATSYTLVPDLAVGFPTVSDGGTTYTFQLRSGIRYSTGALVKPADIRRGIERSLLLSGGLGYLSGVKGASDCTAKACDLSAGIVTTPGSNTITFHLTHSDPDFLYKLALPPADAVPASTPLRARVPLPATGPYRIASYDPKQGVVRLARNPRFRLWSAAAQPAGFPDRIVEKYGYTGPAAVQAVQAGKADVVADGPDQTWPLALATSLQTRYSSRVYSTPELGETVVWLNTRVPPFNDVRVRRALNYAVDRNHLVQLAGGRAVAEVACQVLSPNTEGYQPYCPYTVHPNATGTYKGPDLARARRLVAASGTRGESVTLWFYDIPLGIRNGQYLVSVLRKLGYKARLKTVPHTGSTWRPDRQAGVLGWGADYPSAANVFASFTCKAYDPTHPEQNLNFSAFCNKHIDAEIARASRLQTSDPPEASRLWTTIDRQLTDQALGIVIRAGLDSDFVSGRTGNYTSCFLQAGSTSACLDQLWVS